MKKIVKNLTKISYILITALAVLSSSCTKEVEEEISIKENLPGTWIAEKKVYLELEEGSTWRYIEVSSDLVGEWINVPFSFIGDDSYLIEFKSKDGHIYKYEGNYTLSEDTIYMENIDNFPCHKAGITFNSKSRMVFTLDGVSDKGVKNKTEFHFSKESAIRETKAFNSIKVKQSTKYTCSEVNQKYAGTFKVESVATNVLLVIDDKENITLTNDDYVLVINEKGYFAKNPSQIKEGDQAILYLNKESMTINSTHQNSEIPNSIGAVLFWED